LNFEERNALVLKWQHLVRIIAIDYWRRGGRSVQREDLEGEGNLGLIAAANNFDPSTRVPFEHYARIRIRGAMLDWLRKVDPLSPGERQKVRDGLMEGPRHTPIDKIPGIPDGGDLGEEMIRREELAQEVPRARIRKVLRDLRKVDWAERMRAREARLAAEAAAKAALIPDPNAPRRALAFRCFIGQLHDPDEETVVFKGRDLIIKPGRRWPIGEE
jgi:RNA polymerase sigma factor (sigma-70 family)